MSLRNRLRTLAYRSGALRAWRRSDLRSSLVVAMFHRVLDAADAEFSMADPTCTVSTKTFGALLAFFHRHHSVVGLDAVWEAAHGGRPLPEFPLLITFDDGWRDNLTYAAPLLARYAMPAVIFVAMEAVASPEPAWWQEQIFLAHRTGKLGATVDRVRRCLPGSAAAALDAAGDILDFVRRTAALAESDRALLLAQLGQAPRTERMMLAMSDLPKVRDFGISIGVHGLSHLPLTKVADLAGELGRARAAVLDLAKDETGSRAVAFPHGRYDANVVKTAGACGYELMFSSDPLLNPLRADRIDASRPIGRISIGETPLVDAGGNPDLAAIATWLWLRRARPV
jgi:peptidoglycan/xylan/chitin deacetylase (PgdA/CDA1 family)